MIDTSGALRGAHPSITDLAGRRPDLVASIGDLWGARARAGGASPGERSLPELLVLADRAGALEITDFDDLLDRLGRAAVLPTGAPALTSETPGDRAVIVERLERLGVDPAFRAAWIGLLTDVAATVRSRWEDAGLDVSRRAARARASQLPWTDPARAVIGWARGDYGGLLPALLGSAAATHRPVLVVPSYWSGNGLLFDLEQHVLVGIPGQVGPSDSRARTEPWVRALKALADPTRLAMLDYLGGRARSISELATDFGLAQPTASRHVRLLRESGLVTERRKGSMVLVSADPVASHRLVEGLRVALAPTVTALPDDDPAVTASSDEDPTVTALPDDDPAVTAPPDEDLAVTASSDEDTA
jgi:ArsR family transcriptional regulator